MHSDRKFHEKFPNAPLNNDSEYTSFEEMYDFFLAGITDDMFMELSREDTEEMLQEILIAAIPHFEFPKDKDLFDLDFRGKRFTAKLSIEEMLIIRYYMIAEWIGFQLATVENIRQKYSGSDFKFTSQASHIKQLEALKEAYQQRGFHQQRVYCRREKRGGSYKTTFLSIMEPME